MVILDTNIIIELYKGNLDIKINCEKIGEQNLFFSSIVAAEFFTGALNRKELSLIKKHIGRFPVIHVNESISSIALTLVERYCLSHHPFIRDMIIAATALRYNCPVYTLNKKDFRHIPKLKLI